MNGSFKMQVTKAKHKIMSHKPINEKRFSPTDIMPIVNLAWPESFGRVDFAKTAILERGWGPENYALLDHPSLLHQVTSPSTNGGINMSSAVPTIDLTELNLNGGAVSTLIDVILQSERMNVGRRAAQKKRKEALCESEGKFGTITEGN
jgi:hypothetical protein